LGGGKIYSDGGPLKSWSWKEEVREKRKSFQKRPWHLRKKRGGIGQKSVNRGTEKERMRKQVFFTVAGEGKRPRRKTTGSKGSGKWKILLFCERER